MKQNQQTATLNRLLRLSRDSENGFLVAAENVNNRGLKAMLKTCALERAEFAEDLKDKIRQNDGEPKDHGSFLAGIHRGWIDLKAAMTIGPQSTENVVLAESLRGERIALQTYQRTLEQTLPAEIKALLASQHERIAAANRQIACLLGTSDERLVVRLFDHDAEANWAHEMLVQEGFDDTQIDMVAIDDMIRVYRQKPRRSTVGETLLAAMLLGIAAGGFIGAIIAVSTFVLGGEAAGFSLNQFLFPTLTGAALGAGILAMFGLLIGFGISEEDIHLYDDGVQHGHVLMRVLTDPERAAQASHIMKSVNAEARSEMAPA